MAHEKIRPEFYFDDEKINQLKQIVPECFEDGKINFETLRQNLGDWAQDEDDENLEHFGLFWPGKSLARKLASIPSDGTLEPIYGQGLKPDGTPDNDGENDSKNIFIEGENLEVLKILQKSYANRVKMIYIDPPYNTGKDFIYDDDFTEPLQEYLRRTGQIDEEGKPLTTNKRSDGRFHSKWLSMIYPRLRLSRSLLKDDGVIFVSIDDNEVHNLRSVMNEIFGEENFLGTMKRRASRKSANLTNSMSDVCDYVMVYSKGEMAHPLSNQKASDTTRPVFNAGNSITNRVIRSNTESRTKDGFYPKGIYKVRSLSFELLDDLIIENGKTKNEISINGPWRVNQDLLNKTVYITKNFGLRRYLLKEEFDKPKSINDLIDSPIFYNEKGSERLEELLLERNIFQNPKPVDLIKFLIEVVELHENNEDFIVLDFFGGSGTTSEGFMKFQKSLNRKGKSITVQFPEPISKDVKEQINAYKFCLDNNLDFNIAEITKERIKRAHKSIKPKDGFKVYKLMPSNYKKWQDITATEISQVELTLDEFANSPLKPDWSKNKLLTEIQLLEGFPLDSTVNEVLVGSNTVTKVSYESLESELLICLDSKIEDSLIEDLKLNSNSTFICLDSAISNQDKLRLSDKGLIKTI